MRSAAIVLCTLLLVPGLLAGADALDPPRILDMILLGQEGDSQSTVTRKVLAAGGYVYASGEPGLQTVDARDPAALRLSADWPHSSPKMNGSDLKDGILYVANWSPGEGLVLFDLADPGSPAHRKTLATSAHTWDVDVYGDLLYVSIDDGITTGIVTFDLEDPGDPLFLHFLSIGDRLVGNAARSGNYLYFTHKNWLYVYDARDPADPRYVREIGLNSLGGEARVRGEHLFVLSRTISPGEQGGLRVFSLDDPATPAEVEFWGQEEPRDLHFQGDLIVVPASGSGIYTLDARNPEDLKLISHWFVSWPEMGHGGYPVAASGEGKYVFIGTTSGNNPECEDFTGCSYYGARLYSVQVLSDPPAIAPVSPDPDRATAGDEYFQQLVLLEGQRGSTWSILQGPAGIRVDATGLVRGWTPSAAQIAQTFTLEVRARNLDGTDSISWRVQVLPPPEDRIASFRFESGSEGWALEAWKSGPYDPGVAVREPSGGNPGGCIRSAGSGATNNLDSCNREGGILTRAVSTKGWRAIRVEYDVAAALDSPPGASGVGSCPLLGGTGEDKLVLEYSTAGTAGPWTRAQVLSEGAGLPSAWTRKTADLSGVGAVEDNPLFALRFQWQFNTMNDQGRIDNIQVLGAPIPAEPPFRRGDATDDGERDVSDPIGILQYLFLGGPLGCLDSADVDDSGKLDISDAVSLLTHLFLGGPAPREPYSICGADPTPDDLGCGSQKSCE